MARAIWYPLAKAFREYITEVDSVLVFQVKCAGDDFKSAAIRAWDVDPDFDRLLELTPEHEREELEAQGNHRIRDTILFKEDEIVCSSVTEGFFHIDLACPVAYEILLHWMKRVGLTKQETVLTGVLAPWKEPPK